MGLSYVSSWHDSLAALIDVFIALRKILLFLLSRHGGEVADRICGDDLLELLQHALQVTAED